MSIAIYKGVRAGQKLVVALRQIQSKEGQYADGEAQSAVLTAGKFLRLRAFHGYNSHKETPKTVATTKKVPLEQFLSKATESKRIKVTKSIVLPLKWRLF